MIKIPSAKDTIQIIKRIFWTNFCAIYIDFGMYWSTLFLC